MLEPASCQLQFCSETKMASPLTFCIKLQWLSADVDELLLCDRGKVMQEADGNEFKFERRD